MNNHHHEKTPLNPNLKKIYPNAVILNEKQCESWDVADLARGYNTGNSVSTEGNVMSENTKNADLK